MEKKLKPCQRQWMQNRITDLYGDTYWIAPCSRNIIYKRYGEEPALNEDELADKIMDGCIRLCPFSCDTEKILHDRNECICTAETDTAWINHIRETERLPEFRGVSPEPVFREP